MTSVDTTPDLAGWRVAESARAHSLGQVEESILAPGSVVTLPDELRLLSRLSSDGPQANVVAAAVAGEVSVDRRRVVDGRTYLHVADSRFTGSWVEIDPALIRTEAMTQRVLGTEPRPATVTVVVEREQTVFRFDADGRVIDRRTTSADGAIFTTDDTIDVAGRRFLLIADGELAGWAISESDDLVVLTGVPALPID